MQFGRQQNKKYGKEEVHPNDPMPNTVLLSTSVSLATQM